MYYRGIQKRSNQRSDNVKISDDSEMGRKASAGIKGLWTDKNCVSAILNDYAKEHERQATLDFHHQLKGAILDAVDEGLVYSFGCENGHAFFRSACDYAGRF